MGPWQLLRVGLMAGALVGVVACGGGSDSGDGHPTPIAPGAPASCEEGDTIVTGDTSFDGNETRVGSGEIPLPAVLVPESPP